MDYVLITSYFQYKILSYIDEKSLTSCLFIKPFYQRVRIIINQITPSLKKDAFDQHRWIAILKQFHNLRSMKYGPFRYDPPDFEYACGSGHLDLVKLIIKRPEFDSNWNWGLYNACIGGNQDVIDFIIEKGAKDWYKGFVGACRGGHIDLVKEIMNNEEHIDLYGGFRSACLMGHLDIINLLIEKKGNFSWNEGLIQSCLGGHLDIINLMIDRGATNLYKGLERACMSNHYELLKLKNSTIDQKKLERTCMNNYHKIIKLMISKGVNYCNYCKKSIQEHFYD